MQECIPLCPLVGNIEHVPTCIINSVHGTENWCVEDNLTLCKGQFLKVKQLSTLVVRYVQSLTRIISVSLILK